MARIGLKLTEFDKTFEVLDMVATTEYNKCPDDVTPEGKHFIKQWLLSEDSRQTL